MTISIYWKKETQKDSEAITNGQYVKSGFADIDTARKWAADNLRNQNGPMFYVRDSFVGGHRKFMLLRERVINADA